MSNYGYCPICGAPGKTRERRPDGNDICERGHTYPAKSALDHKPYFLVLAYIEPINEISSTDDQDNNNPVAYAPIFDSYTAAKAWGGDTKYPIAPIRFSEGEKV